MTDQKRFLVAGCLLIIIFIMGYFFDLNPAIEKIAELREKEKELKTVLADPVVTSSIKNEAYNNALPVLTFIQHSGLQLEKMNSSGSENTEMQMTLRGDINRMLAMINTLEAQASIIKNVTLQVIEKNNFQMQINISSQNQFPTFPSTRIINSSSDLFCTPDILDEWFEME